MTNISLARKKELRRIAQEVVDNIIESWFTEYDSWDIAIEEYEISEEEWDYAIRNSKITVDVEFDD